MPASFYNEVFLEGGSELNYKKHWKETPWNAVWQYIVDYLKKEGKTKILDLGCGPGQAAGCLYEGGIKFYTGIDFSEVAINIAKQNFIKNYKESKNYKFICKDLLKYDFNQEQYDAVISTEFLEHIKEDIFVLNKIRKNTLTIITLPNCDSEGHVRYFPQKNEDDAKIEIKNRYSKHFNILKIDTYNYPASTSKDYIIIMLKK